MSTRSPFLPDVLKGKVAFVTGGATGIGFGICQALGKHGAKIAIMGRRAEVLETAVKDLQAEGITVLAIQGDVREPETIQAAVEKCAKEFGKLDILVNNAAGNFMCSAEDLSPNGFATVLAIDLQGTFNTCRAALPYLKEAGKQSGGLIINITATLQYKATPFQAHAASAKAGIDVLTQTLAVEWGEYGIRVVGIAPGPIKGTAGGPGGRVFSMKGGFLPEDPQGVKLIVPVGRYGTIEDIAYTAVFLSTNAASFLSGTTVVVDGGQWHGAGHFFHMLKSSVSKKKEKEKKEFKGGVAKLSAPKMVFHELGHQFAHDQPMNQLSLSYTQLLNPKKGSPKSSGLQEEEDRQTLYKAVISGDLTTVQQLVKTGTDVNVADAHGKSALMAASEAGHLPIVKQLVSKKARMGDKDSQGWTALHYAAVEGHLDVVMHLVKKGHDANARNADLTACLHYLVRLECNEKLKKTINLLIKNGAQVDIKNKFDWTPLQSAASRGKVGVVQFLLIKKANVNARNKFGDSALQMAVVSGNIEMVKLLIENGANPTFKSEGEYGDMIRTAGHCGHHEIKSILEEYTKKWLIQHVPLDPADDQWKVLTRLQRLKQSALVNTERFDWNDEKKAKAVMERLKSPIAKDVAGWILEEGTLQVPKVPVKHGFDVPVAEYNHYFLTKFHFNFVGTQIFGKDDVEPLIVSVATYEEIDGEYRTVLWTIRGTSYMTIPSELLSASDLQGSAKKLVSYLRSFFEEKYSHQNIGRVTVKLEPVPINLQSKVEHELQKFELNDPQMPHQISIGVVYCKEGQKEEEEYFQNDHDATSKEYLDFLKIIGKEFVLKGYDGYRGDLDVSGKNLTGKTAITHKDDKFCILYHVATMLPRSVAEEGEQQIRRKRYIGNDITTVVFQDKGCFPQLIRSQFLHNYIIVSPIDIGGIAHYKVAILRQEDVPESKPTLCVPAVMTAEHLAPFLTSKIISSQWAALRSPKLAKLLIWKVKHSILSSIVQMCKA